MSLEPQRTQEQSIKARKNELFEVDRPVGAPTGPRRSFRECLRTTPAAPLSPAVRALLWVAGVVVVLLLLAALVTTGSKKPKPKPKPRAAARAGQEIEARVSTKIKVELAGIAPLAVAP